MRCWRFLHKERKKLRSIAAQLPFLTGILSSRAFLKRIIHDAFDLRQRSDYAAEYHASREDTETTLKNADSFVDEVKKVLSKEI